MGRTALHHALLNGLAENNLFILRQLLLYGADPHAKDSVSARIQALMDEYTISPYTFKTRR